MQLLNNPSKITPSTPGEFSYGRYHFDFSVGNGKLICSCTYPKDSNVHLRPRLYVAQGLVNFESLVENDGVVNESFQYKCNSVLLIEVKDPFRYQVVYLARAFPREGSYDPWSDTKLPAAKNGEQ